MAPTASPASFTAEGIQYHDYELDVVKRPGQTAEVRDEDEFLDAAARYIYSPEFQENCRRAVEQAIKLVEAWSWSAPREME